MRHVTPICGQHNHACLWSRLAPCAVAYPRLLVLPVPPAYGSSKKGVVGTDHAASNSWADAKRM